MPPRIFTERLAAFRAECRSTDDLTAVVRKHLRSADSLLVTEAAKVAKDQQLHDAIPDLVDRFELIVAQQNELVAIEEFKKARAVDPTSSAKIALLTALKELAYDKPDVFLAGSMAHQYELQPLHTEWKSDSAIAVRIISALALPQTTIDIEQLFVALARLVRDEAPFVRTAANEALISVGRWESRLVLEFTLEDLSDDPVGKGRVFAALLADDFNRYVPFVEKHLLDGGPSNHERFEAICALSECRNDLGAAVLIQHLRNSPVDYELAKDIFAALGRCRHRVAATALLDGLEHPMFGTLALQGIANGIHREDDWDDVRRRVARIDEPDLVRAFRLLDDKYR
jgi:hypothetical protein